MDNKTCLIIPNSIHTFTVEQGTAPIRIDSLLTQQFPGYSRNFFQKLIADEKVTCNNKIVAKSSTQILEGDTISLQFPSVPTLREPRALPEHCIVKVLFEHLDFLIIEKPAGLIVHDASTHHTAPTLVDWLITHFKEISTVGYCERPGIVHRLDQDTSGIMIVARTSSAHAIIGDMFRNRMIQKEYLAIVEGHPSRKGTIDFPISRDPNKRNKMTHKQVHGRASITHYTVIAYYKNYSLVQVNPITGRTHQIRVHFAAIGHPIVGDKLYGKTSKDINRQALHARRLTFSYQQQQYTFSTEIPTDIQKIIDAQKKA